jgi:hypothetical protein
MAALTLQRLMPPVQRKASDLVLEFVPRDFPRLRRVARRALEPNFSVRRFL